MCYQAKTSNSNANSDKEASREKYAAQTDGGLVTSDHHHIATMNIFTISEMKGH